MNTDAYREILAALDALDIPDEDFQDLNAEFEDTLMLLEATDPDDAEELSDAMEALLALKADYERWPEAAAIARRIS